MKFLILILGAIILVVLYQWIGVSFWQAIPFFFLGSFQMLCFDLVDDKNKKGFKIKGSKI